MTLSLTLMDLQGSQEVEGLNPVVLMFQAGYLSIKVIDENTGRVTLGYPNNEVEKSMALLRTQEFVGSDTLDFVGIDKIFPYLQDRNTEGVIECLNHFYAGIVYDRYPINDESMCRGMLYSLLIGLRFTAMAERHNYKGASDLEILTGYPHTKGTVQWVFEIKYSKTGNDADTLLSDAVQQIRSRDYGNPPLADTIVKIAMVFDGTKRQIVRWKSVE